MNINELIARNAKQAFEEHRKREAARGKDFDRTALIAQMADFLVDGSGKHYTKNRVRQALDAYLPESPGRPKRFWRIEYLDAFASVVEAPLYRLVHYDYDGQEHIPGASRSELLSNKLSKRLTDDQLQALAYELDDVFEIPGMWELTDVLTGLLVDASSKQDAMSKVWKLLDKSSVWDQQKSRENKSARNTK